MRTYTKNGCSVFYPDSNIWLNDLAFIVLETGTGLAGAEITITNTTTGDFKILTYSSELFRLSFDINDVVRQLFTANNCVLNFVVNVFVSGIHSFEFGFNSTILMGKSLPDRSHGSTQTIYAFSKEDLSNIELYLMALGTLSVDGHQMAVTRDGFNSFDLKDIITTKGIHNLHFSTGTGISGIEITNAVPGTASVEVSLIYDESIITDYIPGGDLLHKLNLADYKINLVYDEPCDDFNFIEVRYIDNDGCLRYLGGKIMNQNISVKQENIFSAEGIYRSVSQKSISDSTGTVKVHFEELKRDSYWKDILFSEKIEFLNWNGNWFPCSLSTAKVTVDSNSSQDVEIEFEILK